MGERMGEGTWTRWLKKAGEHVEREEPLFEISTDKVDTEIPWPAAGVLKDVLVEEGKTVAISTGVGRIDEGAGNGASGAAPAAQVETSKTAEPVQQRGPQLVQSQPPQPQPSEPQPSQPKPAPPPHPEPPPQPVVDTESPPGPSSPLVRKITRTDGIDVPQVQGRAAPGRIS